MVYAELLNSENGLVIYVNAGHPSPILLRSDTNAPEFLPATGQLLGPFPGEKYRAEFTIMRKGDILLLYTDGVAEAQNEAKELYGEQRLIEVLRREKGKSPKEICAAVLQEVQTFSKASTYSDDKTLIVIKRTR
jgi:phosphoserine phosphatase RsbU/P